MSQSQIKNTILQLSKSDWGTKRQLFLQNQFPYSLQTLKAAKNIAERVQEKFSGRDRLNRWHEKEEQLTMHYIVDQFVDTACKHRTVPVVLFLPDTQRWQKGRRPAQYNAFVHDLRQKKQGLIIVDIALEDFDQARYTLIPYRGHLSEYGNQYIAEKLGEKLNDIASKPWIKPGYCP